MGGKTKLRWKEKGKKQRRRSKEEKESRG